MAWWVQVWLPVLLVYLGDDLVRVNVVDAQGPYHTGTTSWTLFKNSWPVVEVVGGNWSSTVHGSETAWALDMYASWCGHCQRFAPKWKRIASQLQGWRSVVRFAALACSHPQAEQLCIDQSITGYPTIKFYPPNAETTYTGKIYQGALTEQELRVSIIDFLSTITDAPSGFPNLQPVRSTVEMLEFSPDADDKELLLLAENITKYRSESNYLGRYVILDLSSKLDQVVVRRIEAVDAANLGIHIFPSLHRVNPADGSLSLIASDKDRAGFVTFINSHILEVDDDDSDKDVESDESTETVTSPATILLPVGTHDQDLESGLFISLYREVAAHKNLRKSRLAALKTFIHHLAQLLPVRAPVKEWLGRLDAWLSEHPSPVNRTEWQQKLQLLEDEDAYLPKRVIWVGCQSSVPGKRGYPCSLWTIFHTLTIAAYNNPEKGISSRDVVLGMKEYIHRFFGCSECREHFLKMSADVSKEVDNSPDSGVIWLWFAHNKVNLRLHGDPTEDPANPKMQFPTYSKCQTCHITRPGSRFEQSSWDRSEVLKYLVDFYSEDEIIRDALPYTYIATVEVKPTERIQVVSQSARVAPFTDLIIVLFVSVCSIMRPINT